MTQRTLKYLFGLVPIVAGADKFTNLLAHWENYLNSHLAAIITPVLFTRLVGIIEIAAGILVFVKPRLGAYVGDGSLSFAKRQVLPNHSNGTPALKTVMASNSVDRNVNCIGRRPQTGGLSDADRPIIVIEQVKAAGPVVDSIYVWKSMDKGLNWTMAMQLPTSTYASGKNGIFHVLVAPNGDILLLGQTGVFLTQDVFASPPVKIYPASGNRPVSSGYFFGGNATIIAKVTSLEVTHANAKAGLMIRQSLDAGSPRAIINLMGTNTVEFLRRTTSGGTTSRDFATGASAPYLLKLVRSGNSFSAYYSPDGGTWTQLGSSVTITMTGTVYVGLASCSIINTSDLSTSTFESVFVK